MPSERFDEGFGNCLDRLSMTSEGDAAPHQPRSPREIFIAFNSLALKGFGGVLPVAHHELVERRKWLTNEQFAEFFAVSQVLPGPNVVNLALMFGDLHFGLRGAAAALAGMLLLPLCIVLAMAALYGQFAQLPVVSGALRGMAIVAAGLVISTAIKMLSSVRKSPMGLPMALAFGAVTLFATAWLQLALIWVVLGIGSAAVAAAWFKSKP